MQATTYYISKVCVTIFGEWLIYVNILQQYINTIYKCTCVCKCLSLSIYFQSYNSFPPVSIYCAYCLFMYVQISCCPLRALNWSINWIELNWIDIKFLLLIHFRTNYQRIRRKIASQIFHLCLPCLGSVSMLEEC